MSTVLLAEFADEAALIKVGQQLDPDLYRILDALIPVPVEAVTSLLPQEPSHIRQAMLTGGVLAAAFAYGLQAYSAIFAYPLDTGGRPLHSWPVFLLVPVEVGILAAAICGMIFFFTSCRLPRLHHPLFDIPGIERATQDRYFLVIEADTAQEAKLRRHLENAGAAVVSRVPAL